MIKGHGSDGRILSPPLRDDDRDGHYVFSLRDNLTPRCEFLMDKVANFLFYVS